VFIALDYDDTYSADPAFWERVIELAKSFNHNIQIISKRGKDNQGESIKVTSCPVHYTNRQAKALYCAEHGLHPDVWVDDAPMNIFTNG